MFGKNRNKTVGLCVMVVTSCFILATLWAVLAAPETALAKKPGGGGGGGGKKQEIPVSVTFRDSGTDGVQSDGGGAYTRKPGDKVKAFIGMGGQLRLQTWGSRTRTLLLNFPSLPVECSLASGSVHGNLITLGEDTDDDGVLTPEELEGDKGHRLDLLAMDTGSDNSKKAGLRISFPNDGTWYVRFGGGEEGLVTVTATDTDDDGKPDEWTIEAGDGDSDKAAVLPHGEEPCALVKMPFLITVKILP